MSLELPGGTLYSETDGFIEACVVLSEKPSGATTVTVNFVIGQGTAGKILCCNDISQTDVQLKLSLASDELSSTDNKDISFGSVIQVLTFSANMDTVMCLNITIIEDEETEQVESFSITIFTTSTGTSVLPPSSVTISIQDRDCKYQITCHLYLLYYCICFHTV